MSTKLKQLWISFVWSVEELLENPPSYVFFLFFILILIPFGILFCYYGFQFFGFLSSLIWIDTNFTSFRFFPEQLSFDPLTYSSTRDWVHPLIDILNWVLGIFNELWSVYQYTSMIVISFLILVLGFKK
jgi:hypothetical protein